MSTTDSERVASGAAPGCEPKEVFTGWDFYRKAIEHDYMRHRAIRQEVGRLVEGLRKTESMLDLGCGDAEVAVDVLKQRRFCRFVGVDESKAALREAERRLADTVDHLSLHEADMLDFIDEIDLEFDLIVAGYSLHHALSGEKVAFLKHARKRLTREGKLIVYDLFRREGETRAAFLDTYTRRVASSWTAFDPAEASVIVEHMRAEDFPEDMRSFRNIAARARLCVREDATWTDDTGHHRLVCLMR